jgi:hypothetical protein
MQYVILIHHNPATRQVWLDFSPEQQQEGMAAYQVLVDELTASGELVVTQALGEPETASRVGVTDGRTVATDGPYAEGKEFLAGFFLVDVETRERAIEIAGRIPEAGLGQIEVRPVMDLSAFE